MTVKASWHSSRQPVTFDRPNLLLVEGGDDLAFVVGQIDQVEQSENFQVHVMGGNKTGWPDQVEVIMDDDWFSKSGRSVGVVLDADADPSAAFSRGCAALRATGVSAPSAPGVVVGEKPRVGVLVICGLDGTGALEELVMPVFTADQRQRADDYLAESERLRGTPFSHRPKNLVTAYLSAQQKHIATLATAIKIPAVFDPTSDLFEKHRGFLRMLSD